MKNKRVCIFCASSNHCDQKYLNFAYEFGKIISSSGREIIYGGGNVGMMGKIADGFISVQNHSKIIGVIPDELLNLELGHNGLSELIVVDGMHPREKMMMLESDCIIALPGGCGTFSELLQAITWKRLNIIKSPIIILNYEGYYDGLILQLNKSIEENFMNYIHSNLWYVAKNMDDLLYLIDTLEPIKDNLVIKTERNLA
jgi:uncharacterized protein (TIGR00730 family)